jgi:hypothetical protein
MQTIASLTRKIPCVVRKGARTISSQVELDPVQKTVNATRFLSELLGKALAGRLSKALQLPGERKQRSVCVDMLYQALSDPCGHGVIPLQVFTRDQRIDMMNLRIGYHVLYRALNTEERAYLDCKTLTTTDMCRMSRKEAYESAESAEDHAAVQLIKLCLYISFVSFLSLFLCCYFFLHHSMVNHADTLRLACQ